MGAYDALVFNTRRENVPDFGDWEMKAAEKDGLKSYIKSGKGFRVYSHLLLRSVRMVRIRRNHRRGLGYGHELSPAVQ